MFYCFKNREKISAKNYKQRKDFTTERTKSAEKRVYLLLRALITEGAENAEKIHES